MIDIKAEVKKLEKSLWGSSMLKWKMVYMDEGWHHFISTIILYKYGKINYPRYMSWLKDINLSFSSCYHSDRIKLEYTKKQCRGTYHCTVNGEWYNDELWSTILDDLINSCRVIDITSKDIFDALKLRFGKSNGETLILTYYLMDNFVAYDTYNYGTCDIFDALFPNSGLYTINYDDFKPHGYCCEDCDGDYNSYKSSQYDYEVRNNILHYVTKLVEKLENEFPHIQIKGEYR